MDKTVFEIKGMDVLQAKIKKLASDRDKRKPMLQILRRAARSTITAAKALIPVGSRSYRSGSRIHTPGQGKKSIKFQVMRRAAVPMGIVGPSSRGKFDGFHIRQFLIPGHNVYKKGFKRSSHKSGYGRKLAAMDSDAVTSVVQPNYFMNRALQTTQGRVLADAVPAMEKFIQKKIDQL